jgi:hypothetical protein
MPGKSMNALPRATHRRPASAVALLPLLLAACGAGPGSSSADPVELPAFGCGARTTAIHDIQGAATRSRFDGVVVDTEGVVSANLQRGLGGFFIAVPQAEQDADEATSEGLFVHTGELRPEIKVGLRVRVRGTVVEVGAGDGGAGVTAVGQLNQLAVCGEGQRPEPVQVAAPPPDWERYEGMRIALPGPLTLVANHELLRFGRIEVSLAGRLFEPTERFPPGPDARELAAANARARLLVDDNLEAENPRRIWWLGPPVSAARPWRTGCLMSGLTGVIDEHEGRARLQLTEEPGGVEQAARPGAPPSVDGDVSVGAFNLLNWFNGDGKGGGMPTTRGASDASEMLRQRSKLVATLAAIRPDVAALMEVENDGYGKDSALAQLVDALNAQLADGGDYRAVDPGTPQLGSDDIAVAMIYRAGRLRTVGKPASPAGGAFANFNRVPLAQAFEPLAGGIRFVVVANHWKSKGGCAEATAGDQDQGDGQGCFNARRVDAARELSDWLADDPTGSGGSDVLLVGDFNAHGQEDPLRLLRQRGYVDTIAQFAGTEAYSFVYAGASGRLDHALASASLAPRVVGAAEWHINADELGVFDYNLEYKSERRRGLFRADPFRSSDHDPLIVGLRASTP